MDVENYWLSKLGLKWREVPFGVDKRANTLDLLNLSDIEILNAHENAFNNDTKKDFQHRGWFHELYKEYLTNKTIIDIGSGFGISSINFLKAGNKVIFADLVESNLKLIKRITDYLKLTENAEFLYIENLKSLEALPIVDVLFAGGSLHHAPKEFLKSEYEILQSKVKSNGRWLQLAYPETRWIREGRKKFEEWGESTDGKGTPYAMPIDAAFVQEMISPRKSKIILNYEFHNSDFNWIDLVLD